MQEGQSLTKASLIPSSQLHPGEHKHGIVTQARHRQGLGHHKQLRIRVAMQRVEGIRLHLKQRHGLRRATLHKHVRPITELNPPGLMNATTADGHHIHNLPSP